MRARYYHPALGRFISADTIVPDPGNSQDLNRFTYVRNNPLAYVDPSGHCLTPFCIGEIVVGVGLFLLAGCTSQLPVVDETRSFLDVLESDFGLVISSEFTLEERRWLGSAFEQYATFLGGRGVFVQVIMRQGGLREIALDRGGTTGSADPGGILTLHDFSFLVNGRPAYTLDETGSQEVAFNKLVWHETTHFLQFAIPKSIEQYRAMTPELNWRSEQGTWVSDAPGSGRREARERMADALATTLYNQTYAPQFGVSSAAALPETFRPWLLEQLGRR